MTKHSPDIFKTTIFGEPTAVICGPLGNKFLFSNEQKLVVTWHPHSTRKLLGVPPAAPSSDTATNASRTELLRILRAGFLKPEALMRFIEKMDATTQNHMKMYWEGKDEVKVFPLSKVYTLSLACQIFLGLADPDRVTKFVSKFDDLYRGLHSIPLNFPGTIFYRASKAASAIRKELQLIIKEKKVDMSKGVPMQDVVSHMNVATDPTGRFMSEIEILDQIMGLLVAGYSAVATVLTFLMKYVGENPHVYDKIRSEQLEIINSKAPGEALQWEDIQKMRYSWNAANEAMRLTPPQQGTFREAITDFDYAGFTIPKGFKIYWTVNTTNRNPEYFPEPGKFDPSRYEGNGPTPYAFVPFGGGRQMCPGKEYVRLVILTYLHNVVKKYKWEVIYPNEKIIGVMIPTPTQGLPIRLRSH